MEAIILTFDVACMVYLCWRLFKTDRRSSEKADLGWFSYKQDSDA